MVKVYYNKEGWVCNRYPYDIPIDDINRYIEVSEADYAKTNSVERFKAWKVESGKLVVRQKEAVPLKETLEQELDEITKWFTETDYMPNKIITGEWTSDDPRWVNYIAERKLKRTRKDAIIASINQL